MDPIEEGLRLFRENPDAVAWGKELDGDFSDPMQLPLEVELRFKGVEGTFKLVDAVAAGVSYFGFQFQSGPYSGKTIYCQVDWTGGRPELLRGTWDADTLLEYLTKYRDQVDPQADRVDDPDPRVRFIYSVNSKSDGMWFNVDRSNVPNCVIDDWGGDVLPDLDGRILEIDWEEYDARSAGSGGLDRAVEGRS